MTDMTRHLRIQQDKARAAFSPDTITNTQDTILSGGLAALDIQRCTG